MHGEYVNVIFPNITVLSKCHDFIFVFVNVCLVKEKKETSHKFVGGSSQRKEITRTLLSPSEYFFFSWASS